MTFSTKSVSSESAAYSIGALSKKTGVKVPTIRYYEQIGLIEAPVRTEGNQRRYKHSGLERLAFIQHARQLGFSLEDIRELVELSLHPEVSCAEANEIAERHLVEVRERIAKLRKLEEELDRITHCEADHIADCQVIETLADHSLCRGEH